MQTNPTNGPAPVFRQVTPPPVTQAAKDERDEAQIGKALSLKNALDEIPAVRISKVEEARELVDDPKYPPREIIEHISHLLAMKWPPAEHTNSSETNGQQ